jgi:hypothetical protein
LWTANKLKKRIPLALAQDWLIQHILYENEQAQDSFIRYMISANIDEKAIADFLKIDLGEVRYLRTRIVAEEL